MKFNQILLGHKVLDYEVLHQSSKALSYCCSWSCRPEKAMAPHSSPLAWKTPWTEEPGRLQSMGSQTVGHAWATSLSLFTFMHRRRNWQPTPMYLPWESQGWGSLVGCCPWGRRVGHDWSDLAAAAGAADRHQGYGENVRFRRKFLSAQLLFYFRKALIIYGNPFTRCSPS